jgi:hypothetical protein
MPLTGNILDPTVTPTTPTNNGGGSGLQYINTSTLGSQFLPTGDDYLQYQTPTAQPSNSGAPGSNPGLGGSTATGSAGGSSGLLSGLGGILGGDLGNLALYGGLYQLIAGQAENAQTENANLAGGITAVGAPEVAAGQQLVGAFSSGALTTPFQTQLAAALTSNAQTATSQEQQSARALAGSSGGSNISGAVNSQTQQIQAQQSQLDTQAAANAFINELTAGDSLISTGGPYVQSGILTTIQSNTALQAQLAQLMGNLASAYAQSTSGGSKQQTPQSSGSGSGGGGAGGGGAGGGANAGTLTNLNDPNYVANDLTTALNQSGLSPTGLGTALTEDIGNSLDPGSLGALNTPLDQEIDSLDEGPITNSDNTDNFGQWDSGFDGVGASYY